MSDGGEGDGVAGEADRVHRVRRREESGHSVVKTCAGLEKLRLVLRRQGGEGEKLGQGGRGSNLQFSLYGVARECLIFKQSNLEMCGKSLELVLTACCSPLRSCRREACLACGRAGQVRSNWLVSSPAW